jgi:diguanylate cyclase (GGDEF)-like protein
MKLNRTRSIHHVDGWIPRARSWGSLAVGIVVLGIGCSVVASDAITHARVENSLSSLHASSAQIAESLGLSLVHENDLVTLAESFVLDETNSTQSSFATWAKNVSVMSRYPQLFAIGAVRIVPKADLRSFGAHFPIPSMTGSRNPANIAVVPPGIRPYYCLATILLVRDSKLQLPRGLDICKVIPGVNLQRTQFAGLPSLTPANFLGTTLLTVSVPLYRNGVVPATIAGRKAAFVGFIGVLFNTSVDINAALVGHPNTEVALEYAGAGSTVSFHAGTAPQGAVVSSVNLRPGWTAEISAASPGGGFVGDNQALAILFGGIAVSLLLGGFLFLLGTGRARALKLVHERTEELQFLALHDPLTGQPNRILVLDRAAQMLARARRSNLPAALLFLDLDDFKDVNDSLGHRAGDQILIAVASRLAAEVREADTVGRLGGDEFVLLVEGDTLRGGAQGVADRILASLAVPFIIEDSDQPITMSASIGIAIGDRLTAEELLRDADTAMYRAKAGGKHRAVVFNQEMKEAAQDQRALASDLSQALEADQFFLVYQPTIDLQTNALTGVEALLRWRHPERGVVEPNDFIPELEASGLIVSIGTWVLNTACLQGALWMAQGHRFTVSVNVSTLQLSRADFVREVDEALLCSGFDPSMLILEFTETTLMRNGTETISRLEELKSRGVRLAVDDFGTGYSSLAYLRQFPMDVVKIDRAFVSGLSNPNSTEAGALVHALVQLGKALNLQTVAEGIEDDDQRLRLQIEDVDIGQGYLFSRPLNLVDVPAFLERYSSTSGMPMKPASG